MPDEHINTSDQILKDLEAKIKKLSPIVDQLDILSLHFKRLSRVADQIDTLVLSLREGYGELTKKTKETGLNG